MIFFELFFICPFKDPKLAEKWTNLAENRERKKLNSVEFVESTRLTAMGKVWTLGGLCSWVTGQNLDFCKLSSSLVLQHELRGRLEYEEYVSWSRLIVQYHY